MVKVESTGEDAKQSERMTLARRAEFEAFSGSGKGQESRVKKPPGDGRAFFENWLSLQQINGRPRSFFGR